MIGDRDWLLEYAPRLVTEFDTYAIREDGVVVAFSIPSELLASTQEVVEHLRGTLELPPAQRELIPSAISALCTSGFIRRSMAGGRVYANQPYFSALLNDGDRVVGEWLLQAHGTRYTLPHEDPFVVFDLFEGDRRLLYADMVERVTRCGFTIPRLLHADNASYSLEAAIEAISTSGHGAIDTVEGVVWRVERSGKVDFLCKYVRPEKQDGCYLPEISGKPPVWNEFLGCKSDHGLFRWLYG